MMCVGFATSKTTRLEQNESRSALTGSESQEWPAGRGAAEWERLNGAMEEHMERTGADFQRSISSIFSKLDMLEGQTKSAFRDRDSRGASCLQADANGRPLTARHAEQEPSVHDQQACMGTMPLHRFLSPVPQPETAPAEVEQHLAEGECLGAEGLSRATTDSFSSHFQLPSLTHPVDAESNEASGCCTLASNTMPWPDAGVHGQSDCVTAITECKTTIKDLQREVVVPRVSPDPDASSHHSDGALGVSDFERKLAGYSGMMAGKQRDALLTLGHSGLPLTPGATGSPSTPSGLWTDLPLDAGERASRFHLHAVMRQPVPRFPSASFNYCVSAQVLGLTFSLDANSLMPSKRDLELVTALASKVCPYRYDPDKDTQPMHNIAKMCPGFCSGAFFRDVFQFVRVPRLLGLPILFEITAYSRSVSYHHSANDRKPSPVRLPFSYDGGPASCSDLPLPVEMQVWLALKSRSCHVPLFFSPSVSPSLSPTCQVPCLSFLVPKSEATAKRHAEGGAQSQCAQSQSILAAPLLKSPPSSVVDDWLASAGLKNDGLTGLLGRDGPPIHGSFFSSPLQTQELR